MHFFPRASERRVLLIVGSVICVCHTSSHLHIVLSSHLTSSHSHLHIFTYSHLLFLSLTLTSSHLHIFTLTSSHLQILTSSLSLSHTHIFTSSHTSSLSLSPLSSLLSPLSSLLSLSLFSLLLFLSLFRPRAVPARSHETSTLSHKPRFDAQKLRKNCDLTCAGATLSHEMKADAQKLR